MSKKLRILINEYANAYDLNVMKEFSKPKIYDAGGKLFDAKGKPTRWYVYYSFRNPQTNKLERQVPIYAGINRLDTVTERRAAINNIRKAITCILEAGLFNPFVNIETNIVDQKQYDIVAAFAFVRELKKNTMEDTSFKDFRSRINQFEKWIVANGYGTALINEITKKSVINYLNQVQLKSSAKNRNNTRAALGTFFQTLEDNDIIEVNFVDKINVLASKPTRNKTYTKTEELALFAYIEKSDPVLLLLIKFICYTFLRPIEICRLRIKDIDVLEKKIQIKTKSKPVKIKFIPKILIDDLPDFESFDRDAFLFSPKGFGNAWISSETSKREYFTEKFKAVKKKFKLDENYGLYSFRHTFITKLYNSLLVGSTPFEAKSRLMLITGHTTMTTLEKYLRDIDAVLPDDYSEHFKQ